MWIEYLDTRRLIAFCAVYALSTGVTSWNCGTAESVCGPDLVSGLRATSVWRGPFSNAGRH